MPKSSLAEDVLSHVQQARAGWWFRLTSDQQQELLALKQQYQRGELRGLLYQVAAGIRQAGLKRGWLMPGEKGLATWLKSP